MTLTVRLPQPLERKLEAYCAEHGLTKTHVVEECLARYLVTAGDEAEAAAPMSENYLAFRKAGLIGCVSGDGRSATKEVVRERIAAHFKAKADARKR